MRIRDYFGDDEEVLDIVCRPAVRDDLPAVAMLAAETLNRTFSPLLGVQESKLDEILLKALESRLRHDCTWVMEDEGKVIGTIDLETVETRRLNGPSLARVLAGALELTEKIRELGLMPLLMHEPEENEAHMALVSLLPGSRGEGRGTLLLMHGALWAKAQGKDTMTTWFRLDDPFILVYERRGFTVVREVEVRGVEGPEKWGMLARGILPRKHKKAK